MPSRLVCLEKDAHVSAVCYSKTNLVELCGVSGSAVNYLKAHESIHFVSKVVLNEKLVNHNITNIASIIE